MFGVVLPDLLYIFFTKSSPKPSVSSIIHTSPNLSNLCLIIVWLQIYPFSIDFFMDIAHWKSRILFLIPLGMFDPPALLNHTLSKSCYLINELFPTNSVPKSFIPRTCQLWNTLPSISFPEPYNLSCLYKVRYKRPTFSECAVSAIGIFNSCR